MLKQFPFYARVIAQEMVRRGWDAMNVDVVEPFAEIAHAPLDFPARRFLDIHGYCAHAKMISGCACGF